MNYKLPVAVLAGLFAASCALAAGDAPNAREARRKFDELDRNRNRELSLEEFLAGNTASAKVAKRDFRLFDQNVDETLSINEFLSIPTVVGAKFRRGVPDPVLLLVEQAVAAMDESFGNWDSNPDLEIGVQQFVGEFATTLGCRWHPMHEHRFRQMHIRALGLLDRSSEGSSFSPSEHQLF